MTERQSPYETFETHWEQAETGLPEGIDLILSAPVICSCGMAIHFLRAEHTDVLEYTFLKMCDKCRMKNGGRVYDKWLKRKADGLKPPLREE